MDYVILSAEILGQLESMVRSALARGYIPQGGISVQQSFVRQSYVFYQAMYKPKESAA